MKYVVLAASALLMLSASCGSNRVVPPAPQPAATSASKAPAEESDEEEEETEEDAADGEAPAQRASATVSAPPEPDLPEVVLEPIEPSPSPKQMPTVAILSPVRNGVIPSAKAVDTPVRLAVKGWPLTDGNHVQVLVDNGPYVRVDDLKRPVKLGELAPASALGPGQHFIAAVLARGNLETVKPSGKQVPAAVVPFFIDKKGEVRWKEGTPILLYSAPQSGPSSDRGLLVDFYVMNTKIERGRTVVHLSVSGPGLRAAESLSEWKPWRVRNVRPGLHLIQIALYRFEAGELESESVTSVTYVSKPMPGPWSSVTREFTVTR